MSIDTFRENWALWLALASGLIALIPVCVYLIRQTSRGRLRQVRKSQRHCSRNLARAAEQLRRAESCVARLRARAERVKPRKLEEAVSAVEDARLLAKIADDQLQVTTNHVRRVIFEEFPPSKHEKLRARYLPQDVIDKRPFTF